MTRTMPTKTRRRHTGPGRPTRTATALNRSSTPTPVTPWIGAQMSATPLCSPALRTSQVCLKSASTLPGFATENTNVPTHRTRRLEDWTAANMSAPIRSYPEGSNATTPGPIGKPSSAFMGAGSVTSTRTALAARTRRIVRTEESNTEDEEER